VSFLIDIETRSGVDLRSSGGRAYAVGPDTEILTASWYDTETTEEYAWIPGVPQAELDGKHAGMVRTHFPRHVQVFGGQEIPAPLLTAAASGRPWVAHNAWGFDAAVWAAQMPPEAQPATWIDTAPLARAVGLPGGLDRIGRVLRGEGKQAAGRSRLKKFMKTGKKAPSATDLILIGSYCWDDTCGLLKTLWNHLLERPLHEFEGAVLGVHRTINDDGVRFDSALAYALRDLAAHASLQALTRCQELTGGPESEFKTIDDLRKKDLVIGWILRQSARLSEILPQTAKSTSAAPSYSLRKEVVEQLIRDVEAQQGGDDDERDDAGDALDRPDGDEDPENDLGEPVRIPSVVVEFLKARFAVLRVTKGKLDAAINAGTDGRLYDLLVYYGAHTGRFSGRRMQIHNMPWTTVMRTGLVPVWELLDLFRDTGRLDPDRVQEILVAQAAKLTAKRLLDEPDFEGYAPANLDDAASAMIRMTLLPEKDEFFSTGDYNAIELRGSAWVADEEPLLEMLRHKKDPYCVMAEKIYGRPCVNKKDPIRQVGKVVVLGATYQLGERSFAVYAASQGVDLEAAGTTPRACISGFRDLFPEIAGHRTGEFTEDGQPMRRGGIWSRLQVAAIKAVESRRPVRVGRLTFRMVGTELHMVLPSGRPIVYRDAELEWVTPAWERGKKDPKKRESVVYTSPRGYRDVLYGGKLLENAVQALCRDLLAWATVECARAGIKVRFHIHDELVCSVRTKGEAREAMRIMSNPPAWADGFPIVVEADMMPRYAKSAPPGWESFVAENGRIAV
jgi:DNA polymerase bacteriophage-type